MVFSICIFSLLTIRFPGAREPLPAGDPGDALAALTPRLPGIFAVAPLAVVRAAAGTVVRADIIAGRGRAAFGFVVRGASRHPAAGAGATVI